MSEERKFDEATIAAQLNYWSVDVLKNARIEAALDFGQSVLNAWAGLIAFSSPGLAAGICVVSVVTCFVVTWVKIGHNGTQGLPWKEIVELLSMMTAAIGCTVFAMGGSVGWCSLAEILLAIAWFQNFFPLFGAYMVRALIWVIQLLLLIMGRISWSFPDIMEQRTAQLNFWKNQKPS